MITNYDYRVDGPQHSQVVTANLLERQPPGQHLPQDDAPAEHVALLGVLVPLEHLPNMAIW